MKKELSVLVCCAVIIAWQAFLGGKEAYEYVNPYILFWLKFLFAGAAAGALVAKAYTSRSYADYQDDKAAKEAASNGTSTVTATELKQITKTVSEEPPVVKEPLKPLT